MIDKNLTLDRTRTSCLKPELSEGIETGDLLSPENAIDIETGNLLTSKSKVDIETGGLLTANPLPATSNFPLNYARIGYDSTLVNGSASATSDDLGSSNLLTPSTYDKWRPIDNASATLTGGSQQCNYVGIAAHNLGTLGTNLKVEVADGGSPTTIYDQLVTSDKAFTIRFTASTYCCVTLTLSGATGPTTTEIGVVFLGLELEMMRPIYTGVKPSVLSADDKMTPQMTDGGQFVGKQIVRQGFETSADFQHLTYEWYESEFQPFVEHAKTRPYFWAWNLLEHPNDIIYGWTNQNISPTLMGIRNWLEVSFEIKGHG